LPADEWKRLFERYDVEYNGRVDGQIPVKDFEKVKAPRLKVSLITN